MAFGPFPLISIEWLEVPAVALFPRANHLPAQKIVQDIAAVESALLSSGKSSRWRLLPQACGSLDTPTPPRSGL
jgi:hypothetical protein